MIREAAEWDVRVHQLILCVATILDNLLFVVEEQLPKRQGDEPRDAVSKQVQPEGILSRADPLLLQLQNDLHRVEHAVGHEEEGKAALPQRQAGAANLQRDLGPIGRSLLRIETLR